MQNLIEIRSEVWKMKHDISIMHGVTSTSKTHAQFYYQTAEVLIHRVVPALASAPGFCMFSIKLSYLGVMSQMGPALNFSCLPSSLD
jgi:hypothetical protein